MSSKAPIEPKTDAVESSRTLPNPPAPPRSAPTDLWGLWSDEHSGWLLNIYTDVAVFDSEQDAATENRLRSGAFRPVRLAPAPTFGVPEVLELLRDRLGMLLEGFDDERQHHRIEELESIIADIEAAAKERA